MRNLKRVLLLVLITLQFISCSSDDSVPTPSITGDDILEGSATSIGNTPGGSTADFSGARDVTIDNKGDVYVADTQNSVIKQVKMSDGSNSITVFAGNGTNGNDDGAATQGATFSLPTSIVMSPDNKTLYVACGGGTNIRAIDMASKMVTTFAGSTNGAVGSGSNNGIGTNAQFVFPTDIVIDSKGETLYVSENIQIGSTVFKRIRKIDVATKNVTTMSLSNLPTDFNPFHMVIDSKDENLYLASRTTILKINLATNIAVVFSGAEGERATVDGVGVDARFEFAYSLAFSPNETYLYVGQGNGAGQRAIRAIHMETKEVTTIAGGNDTYGFVNGSSPEFKDIFGMALDKSTSKLYIADAYNNTIRVIE